MDRPQSMSRRGFLRDVLGVSTAIFAGPGLILPEKGLILPEKKLVEFYAYEEIVWTPLWTTGWQDRDMAMRFYARLIAQRNARGDSLPKVRGLLADKRQPQRRTA